MQVRRYIFRYIPDIVMEETKEIDTICGTHRMDMFN